MSKNKIETISDIEEKRRNKGVLILIAIILGTMGISFLYTVYSFISAKKEITSTGSIQNIKEGIKEYTIEKDWKTYMDMELKQQQGRILNLEEKIKSLERSQNDTIEILKQIKNSINNLKEETKNLKQIKVSPPITAPNQKQHSKLPSPKVPEKYTKPKKENKFLEEEVNINKEVNVQKEISTFTPKREKKKDLSNKELKLPVGFVKGVLLSGSDFPTMQYGRNNPHPVYLSIEDKVFLANNKRLNLKGCLAIGSGWGEVSSERAYILLSKISCITKDGKLIEKPIQGWVMDDDGKTGLRGRFVTKQGAYLARSLMAGFLSGISRVLSASATTVQISPIGTTSTINSKDALKISAYSGVGNAAERLARFYEKMAEQIFPVIEVNGGRRVVIAFKGGNDISKDKKILETNPLKGGK